MTRIILILLLLSVAAFAAPQPYYDYFPVYVFGDAESVAEVFNINVMLFQERGSGSFFWWLLIFSFVILMFRAAWKVKESDWQSAAKEGVWMFFLLFIVLAPIATVKIVDKRFEGPYMNTSGSSYIKVVDNVPYALAWIASGASVTKYYILTLTNNILGTSGDYSTVQNRGFGRSYDDIKKILESSENLNSMRNQDASNFIVNLNAYLSECALPSLYTTPGNREKVMNPNDSYMNTLAPASLGIDSSSDTMNSGESCQNFWNTKVADLSDEYLTHTKEMAGRIYGADSNETALNAAFTNPGGMAKLFDSAALSSIGGMQGAMREASISAAIRKTVMDNSALAGFDAATAANMERSKQSLLQDGVSSFAWMQEMLPMLQHWMMVQVILLYFPMVMVALFKPAMGGLMSLISYAGGFFLFEMTDVSFEVVQYLTNLWGGKEALEIYTVSNSGQYFSVTNYAPTIDYLASMSGVSAIFGLMSMSLISTIVIKGQVGNLAALSGNLKGMMKGDVLNSGGQEFSTDMAAREHEEAQNRMRKDKMDELTKNGYDGGRDSFETDKLYAQMQSEMAGASKGAAMHHAVADGHGDEVARSAGYKAESGMQAEIAYAEVLEANTGGAPGALDVSAKAGRLAGIGAASTDLATVATVQRAGRSSNKEKAWEEGTAKYEEATKRGAGAQTVSTLAKADAFTETHKNGVSTEAYIENIGKTALMKESEGQLSGEIATSYLGDLKSKVVLPSSPGPVGSAMKDYGKNDGNISGSDWNGDWQDINKNKVNQITGKKGGDASWRNNNPGNLMAMFEGRKNPVNGQITHSNRNHAQAVAAMQKKYDGVVDIDKFGSLIFDSMDKGDKAQKKLIGGWTGKTISQAIKTYAPPSDANNTAAYIQSVASSIGVSSSTKIGALSSERKEKLFEGIKAVEGQRKGTYIAKSNKTIGATDNPNLGVHNTSDNSSTNTLSKDASKKNASNSTEQVSNGKKTPSGKEDKVLSKNTQDAIRGTSSAINYDENMESPTDATVLRNDLKKAPSSIAKVPKSNVLKEATAAKFEVAAIDTIQKSDLDDTTKAKLISKTQGLSEKMKNPSRDVGLLEKYIKDSFAAAGGGDIGEDIIDQSKKLGVPFEQKKNNRFSRMDTTPDNLNAKEEAGYLQIKKKAEAKSNQNRQDFMDGKIDDDEYLKREDATNKIVKNAMGNNEHTLKKNMFEKAGFSQKEMDDMGLEFNTKAADGQSRMTQRTNIDPTKIKGIEEDTNVAFSPIKQNKVEESKAVTPESKVPSAENTPSTAPTPKKEEEKETPRPANVSGGSVSWVDAKAAMIKKGFQETLGAGAAIISNQAQDSSMYTRNAFYSELSKTGSTAQQIAVKGGVHEAVASDIADAGLKAAMQQSSTAGDIEAFAKKSGMDAGSAKEFTKAIMTGATSAKDIIAQGITGAAGNLAAALAGAKTGSSIESVSRAGGKDGYVALSETQAAAKTTGDIKNIEHAGGSDDYIRAAGVEGAKKGAVSRVQNIGVGTNRNSQRQVDGMLALTKDEDKERVLESMKHFGMVTSDATLSKPTATSGESFIVGKAASSAATMSKDDRLSLGGYTFNVATDSSTGDTKVDANDAQGLTTGRYVHDRYGVNIVNPVQKASKALGGDTTEMYLTSKEAKRNSNFSDEGVTVGEVAGNAVPVLAGMAVVAGADRMTGSHLKKAGKKVWNAGAELSPLSTGDESTNERSNQKDNRGHDNSNPKSTHNNSPSINSRIHNSNIKTPQTQAWYKEIGKSFAKTKAGKILGTGAVIVGLSSVAGAAEQEYLEFTADNATTMPPQNNTPELSSTDAAVIMGTAAVGNGATAMHGMQELKAGSSTATKVLAKDGTKLAGKMAGKLIPGVGLALGAKFASEEFDKGNYGRATLEMLSGVTSLVPGVGTLASAAIDMGLATESVMNPEQEHHKLSRVSKSKAGVVGAAALGALATGSQRTEEHQVQGDNVLRKLSKGQSITKDELVSSGANESLVNTLPTNNDGSINQISVGQQVQSSAAGVLNQGNNLSAASSLSTSAASAINNKQVLGEPVINTAMPETQAANTQTAQSGRPADVNTPSADAVDAFMGTMNTATSRQIGATALAMSAPEGSQQPVFELAMNSGNISPAALNNMGLDPAIIEQMRSQFSTDGNTIDVSTLGSAMQANAAANFTSTKLGTASVDNSDLLNAITNSAGDHNLDSLEAIIDQRAGSNGVTMKTADGEVNIGRDRNDNLTIGGEPTNANYQEFRESLASSSPSEQNQMASSIAQSNVSDVFEKLDGNDRNAWKDDGGYMLDMARDTRTGNEDARSGFIDISFALEEQTEMFQETLQNAMDSK